MSRSDRSNVAAPPEAAARLRDLVFAFYDRVRRDEVLGPVFEARIDGRWDAHVERMCDFWSSVLYSSGRYRGDPVGVHARLPGIGPAHFDRWITLFEDTASKVLPEAEASDIVARSKRMRVVLEQRSCP